MANSKIELFKVEFRPENNAWVDKIVEYLSSNKIRTINDFQYIKHALEVEIVIELSQSLINNLNFNYVSIKNEGENRIYYYFVTSSKWASNNAVKLGLSMDTINTFQDHINFSPNTLIIRQHEDRFIRDNPDGLYFTRNINRADEGANGLSKYRASTIKLSEAQNGLQNIKWYLIYNSDKTLTTNPDEVNPISCYLLPNKALNFKYEGAIGGITLQDLAPDDPQQGAQIRAFLNQDNPSGQLSAGGVRYTITSNISYVIYKSSTNEKQIFVVEVDNKTSKLSVKGSYDRVELINIKLGRNLRNSYGFPTKFINSSAWYAMACQADDVTIYKSGGNAVRLSTIDNIDRSKTTLLKIIELPYAPTDLEKDGDNNFLIPNGWNLSSPNLGTNNQTLTSLKLDNLNIEFGHTVTKENLYELRAILPSKEKRYDLLRDDNYESKLFNSSFYNLKFIYDSYAIDIKCENINIIDHTKAPQLDIYFKPSNSINSNMIFNIYPSDKGCEYVYDNDYGNIITTERNNELPLFNSNYLNYLRNGYNYDLKNKKLQSIKTWAGVGLNIVGAAIAGAAAIGTGGLSIVATSAIGANAISGISNAIISEVSATDKINQTLEEARNQAANVTGANDLDLLNYYNGNKLVYNTYSIYDNVKLKIADLFYFCGYAINRRGRPAYSSRRSFNYVQCEADFGVFEEQADWINFIQDVKARYQAGVTYYHNFSLTPGGHDNYYDFDQEYENWELFICPRK